jgi:hypothetical protein
MNNSNLSLELRLLVLSIKVSLSGEEKTLFKETLLSSLLGWERVHALVNYHQIIPVFYNACKEVSFQNKYVDQYEIFSKRQAITNLLYEQEYLKVEQILSENQIRVIPYKGVLFLKELYKEKPLRQMSDLDILVHERDAVHALQLLLKDGYKIKETADTHPESLERLISDIPNKEISLHKSSLGGSTIWLDFHWHINALKQAELSINDILDQIKPGQWSGKTISIPDRESVFIMLLNHHAERDCWARLKYICDFWMFLNEVSFDSMQNLAAEKKMLKVYNGGLQLVHTYLDKEISFAVETPEKTLKRVIQMWEVGQHWNQLMPKIRILLLYKNFRDQNVTWMNIFWEQVDYHSKKGFNKHRRLINFPEKFKLLNAVSKLTGYLFTRAGVFKE